MLLRLLTVTTTRSEEQKEGGSDIKLIESHDKRGDLGLSRLSITIKLHSEEEPRLYTLGSVDSREFSRQVHPSVLPSDKKRKLDAAWVSVG